VLFEGWRRDYNRIRPHSSLGHRPPAPEAVAWPPGARRPPVAATVAGLKWAVVQTSGAGHGNLRLHEAFLAAESQLARWTGSWGLGHLYKLA
jgi:hypothetical protein